MAQNLGDEKNEPSLELPTLKLPGLGRRRRSRESPVEPQPAVEAAEPVQDPTPPEVPAGEPAPGPETAPEAGPETAREPEPERTSVLEPESPAPAVTPRPRQDPEPHPTLVEPAPGAAEPEPPAPEQAPPTPVGARRRAPRTADLAAPRIPGRLAAGLTGLLVGAAGAAATYGAMEGCEEVRGVSTCGGAPGFFILVAIVVLMVLFGALVLKALKVADTPSTSFLAVGIVTVVVMLTLLDQVFSPWMFVVIPLLSAAAFVLAHWVTTRFEHEDTGRRDWT